MTTMSTAEILRYIADLELAVPAPSSGTAPVHWTDTADDEASYVNKGSLTSFVKGLTQQHKDDVLNSTLLASLAADKQASPEDDPRAWYSAYRSVLAKIHWNMTEVTWDAVESSSASFEVNTVVYDLILSMLGPGEVLSKVMATIETCKKLGEDNDSVKLFDRNAHKASKGNFQMACAQEDDGDVLLSFGAFYFTTSQTVTQVLWTKFTAAETSFFNGSQTMVLNETAYAKIREAIVDKLGTNAEEFIRDLDI